jgi:hypothetical protein
MISCRTALAGAFALAASLTLAAGTEARAQAGGVGAGPVNSKSSIAGRTGRMGAACTKSRRGTMKRRYEAETPRGTTT